MRVLMLDFDGVLNNSVGWERDRPKTNRYVSRENVQCLRRFLKAAPDVKLVISSAWRIGWKLDKLRAFLSGHGVDPARVIDVTPVGRGLAKGGILLGVERGHEIQQWLDVHPGVKKFAIVDDTDAMAHLKKHLVQTNPEHGLTDKDVERILEKLA